MRYGKRTRISGSALRRIMNDPQADYERNVKHLRMKLDKMQKQLDDAGEFQEELLAIINDYAGQIDRLKRGTK